MNFPNSYKNFSTNIFEFDDPICLYFDTLHGMKSIRKPGMPPPPPRATSLFGLSSYNLDRISESHQYISNHNYKNESMLNSHRLFENDTGRAFKESASYYNFSYHQQQEQNNIQQQRTQPYESARKTKYKMSVLTKDSNSLVRLIGDDIGDNLSAVLREKMPNNELLYNEDKKWLCNDYVSEFHKARQIPAYKLLDNKINDNRYVDVERINPKRKFRTRSESEPNEISSLISSGTWSKQNEKPKSVINNSSKYQSDLANKYISNDEYRAVKLPATPKRYSPARVRLYNNSSSPKFSRHIAQLTSVRHCSPVHQRRGSSLSRLHDNRRTRTRSPSFTYASSDDDSAAEYEVHSRKAKSVTPTPTHGSLKYIQRIRSTISKSSSTAKSPPTRLKVSPSSASRLDGQSSYSSMDDDLDVDQDSDIPDDLILDSVATDTSESDEDGYRSHAYKTSYSGDKLVLPLSSTFKSTHDISCPSSEESLVNPDSLLVSSLFPNVPPYLTFSSNTKKGPYVPPELFRILKWKVTNIMPRLVRQVLANSGVRLLKKTNDWMGTWGKHMKSTSFKTIRPYQKVNHLPGSFRIGRKDACWKNLQRQTIKHGKKEFGFMPKTYIMPSDLNILRKAWPKYAQRNVKWIIKPPASARGTGIRVVNRWAQIPKRKPLIVQKYIERPLLINGSKFDLRLYVLVTSINPLRVYMYHNGLARFASVKYSAKSDTLNERCMHLTNYSINKFSSNYSRNDNVNACHGHKWTIKSLWAYLAKQGVRTDRLWDALKNLVMRTLLAGEHAINTMVKVNVESKYSCFELFGFDVLLDADLVPWLLEVNISPSLHSELPLDTHVKAPLVQGVLNTALYNIPPKLTAEEQKEVAMKLGIRSGPLCFDKRMYVNYLSRTERFKHNQFTRKTLEDRDDYINAILENLTPDDIRCLVVAEDELARCAPLERIFPTYNTHKYLKYTEVPRYYNRLLDAWENRYAKNRDEGIKLLKRYCEQKYHLEVPPSPVRKNLKRRTRAIRSIARSTLALTTAVKSIKRRNKRHILNSYQHKKHIQRQSEEDYDYTSSDLEVEP